MGEGLQFSAFHCILYYHVYSPTTDKTSTMEVQMVPSCAAVCMTVLPVSSQPPLSSYICLQQESCGLL